MSCIITDEVILTEERLRHIQLRHPFDYERFQSYLPIIIEEPDYIIADERPDTALILKEIYADDNNEYFRIALKLATSPNTPTYKNSILTFWKTREKEYKRLIKNKKILYRRE